MPEQGPNPQLIVYPHPVFAPRPRPRRHSDGLEPMVSLDFPAKMRC